MTDTRRRIAIDESSIRNLKLMARNKRQVKKAMECITSGTTGDRSVTEMISFHKGDEQADVWCNRAYGTEVMVWKTGTLSIVGSIGNAWTMHDALTLVTAWRTGMITPA